MSIFIKQDNKPTVEAISEKRDITIRNEPRRQPDHVIAEIDDARWTIPLNKDERYDLAVAYEKKLDKDGES